MTQELEISQLDNELYDEERAAKEPTEQFVSFRLGSEWYAIRISNVREVLNVNQVTYLPSAPGHIAGIINVRGSIVSVTDLKQLLGLAPTAATGEHCIVVIEIESAETSLLVDEVGEVVDIPLSRLEPPLITLDVSQAAYIEHTCRWNDRLMAILKGDKLLGLSGQGLAVES